MTSNDTINPDFKKWALLPTGFDGGDWGSPENPSIWICGLEWGGVDNKDIEKMKGEFANPKIHAGYEDTEEEIKKQLDYRFNQACYKILHALATFDINDPHHTAGKESEGYADFFQKTKPFVEGKTGYLKINLYPLAFKNTNTDNWASTQRISTGIKSKEDYKKWIEKERFPVIRRWTEKHKPRLILCFGTSHRTDFAAAFLEPKAKLQKIDKSISKGLTIYQQRINDGKTLVVIAAHPTSPSKVMKSDQERENLGKYLAEALNRQQ